MNPAFKALLEEKFRRFQHAFSETSRGLFVDQAGDIIHPAELGEFRERAFRDLLRAITPGFLQIGSGFVMTPDGKLSTQTDVVIYDGVNAPLAESLDNQRFYPVESVAGVGEVKSTLTPPQLKEALRKLARTKALRESLTKPSYVKRMKSFDGLPFDPVRVHNDQIFSFLVCEKLDCDLRNLTSHIRRAYGDDVEPHLWHNMLLSLADGVVLYRGTKNEQYPAPCKLLASAPNGLVQLPLRMVKPSAGNYEHMMLFSTYLFMLASNTSLFYPEMASYIPTIETGEQLDEEINQGRPGKPPE